MKSFAVIGLGLFGSDIAKELFDAGHNVLAIDYNEDIVEEIADHVTRAVCLDAKNRDALKALAINRYDCVIVAITGDLATAVLITMNLKALNVPQIVCKVQSETDKEVLETLGASTCIIPEHIAATKLAMKLTGRNVIDFTQLSEHHAILEIAVPENWVNKSLMSMNIRSEYGINVIAIRRDGKLKVDFEPTKPLKASDELIIIGNLKNLERIQKLK